MKEKSLLEDKIREQKHELHETERENARKSNEIVQNTRQINRLVEMIRYFDSRMSMQEAELSRQVYTWTEQTDRKMRYRI